MYFSVISASYMDSYKIKLAFKDGSSGIADLSEYAGSSELFEVFNDLENFKNFKIEFGTLVWKNGELDIAPETLYTRATGKPIEWEELELSSKD